MWPGPSFLLPAQYRAPCPPHGPPALPSPPPPTPTPILLPVLMPSPQRWLPQPHGNSESFLLLSLGASGIFFPSFCPQPPPELLACPLSALSWSWDTFATCGDRGPLKGLDPHSGATWALPVPRCQQPGHFLQVGESGRLPEKVLGTLLKRLIENSAKCLQLLLADTTLGDYHKTT